MTLLSHSTPYDTATPFFSKLYGASFKFFLQVWVGREKKLPLLARVWRRKVVVLCDVTTKKTIMSKNVSCFIIIAKKKEDADYIDLFKEQVEPRKSIQALLAKTLNVFETYQAKSQAHRSSIN